MSNASEYLSANEKYLTDKNTVAAISLITDAQWPVMLAALEELVDDAPEPGFQSGVAWTAETIADFDDARMTNWSERGGREAFEFCGVTAVKYDRFQLFQNQPRRFQIVVDFGDKRLSLYK